VKSSLVLMLSTLIIAFKVPSTASYTTCPRSQLNIDILSIASTSTARRHYLPPTFSDSCRNKRLICIPCPLSPTYPSHIITSTISNHVARACENLQYLVTYLFEEECACLSSHHPETSIAHCTIPAMYIQHPTTFLFPNRKYPEAIQLQHARAKRHTLRQSLWKMVFAKLRWCK
jgi:hypothetical protein